MEPVTVNEICEWTKGKLIVNTWEAQVTGVSTDTRTIKPGDLFVPIKGENFDGHNFIVDAIATGASGVFIAARQKKPEIRDKNYFVIQVPDTKRALGDLAKGYRAKFIFPVIAITGSNGKTTVKEMIASILSQRYGVLKNEGNLNNEIGLPLTLFQLEKKHQVAVIELGMSALGEIRRLTEIAQPAIGVVTNVSEAHLEFFKSVDEIAVAKSELVAALEKEHTAVLNADDERVARFAKLTKARVTTFGIQQKADFQADSISFNQEKLGLEFELVTPKGKTPVFIPIIGAHHIYNALAASAAVWSLTPDLEFITQGLAKVEPPKMRLELVNLGGITIINDAYNANPKSMDAALQTLAQMKTNGRKIAVLGTMRELGEISGSAHQQLGTMVASLNLDYLITVGELGRQIAVGAKQAGMKSSQVYEFESNQAAAQLLSSIIRSGDLVLIKASRKIKLEEIVSYLQTMWVN
ncbi:MAG: UDP-N-acetylmuramoyl-tripeptide--D-alanyl-D-alanine ligase [bacterium]|nr:UDP-N-acetylmuramoyl-tripeptide--D-alanyl-D-alanine ligase [bacterium]